MRASLPRLALAFAVAVGAVSTALVGGSSARSVSVTAADFSFAPARLTVGLGTEVVWEFQGSASHTSTSPQGFWSSGSRPTGTTYRFTFMSAGTYPYYCVPHRSGGMTGSVRVPLRAVEKTSGAWALRWSAWATTPSGRRFDVQIKRPGSSSWRWFRTDTASARVVFDPSRAGVYRFRARTDNVSAGTHSRWSPARSVTVS